MKEHSLNNQLPSPRLISQKEVVSKVNLSRSTIYLRMKSGDFPQSIQITQSRIGWLESEINQFIEDKVRESRSNNRF